MKILGNRVYLNIPKMKEYIVTVPEEVKALEQQKYIESLDKLTVFAIGEEVKNVKIGDQVFVDPIGLRRARMIEINKENKVSVEENEIMHIW